MNYLTISYDEITDEILEDDSTILVKAEPVRWGTLNTYVFKGGSKYWKFTARFSSEDGMISPDSGDTVQAIEVEPVPVTTIKWQVVE